MAEHSSDMALETVSERRKVPRADLQGRVEINVLASATRLQASSVNLSEVGICLRLQETLEINARVRLRLFADASKRPLEFGGRIAWVVQRLDLRDAPPFVYDIGVEFVDPPARLREFVARAGMPMRAVAIRPQGGTLLRPAMVNDRRYVPRLDQEPSPAGRWHLVVTVDGVPCSSRRFTSERSAVASWQQFKRQASKAAPAASRALRLRAGADVRQAGEPSTEVRR